MGVRVKLPPRKLVRAALRWFTQGQEAEDSWSTVSLQLINNMPETCASLTAPRVW